MNCPLGSDSDEFCDPFQNEHELKTFLLQESPTPKDSESDCFLHSTVSSDPPISYSWARTRIINSKRRGSSQFPGLCLAQELHVSANSISLLKFSPHGESLSIGLNGGEILILRASTEIAEGPQRLFTEEPYLCLGKHSGAVRDLAWSEDSCELLSAGEDRLILVWKVGESRAPIQKFRHPHAVNSVAFYPGSSQFFVTGCADGYVRVWDLKHSQMICYVQLSETVTSGSFSPAGDIFIAGMSNGECVMHELNLDKREMRILFTLKCRNSRGRMKNGRNVTGIQFLSETTVLVTTNDSKMRLFDLTNNECIQKYKGHTDLNSRGVGGASNDRNHIICGCETGNVLIWETLTSKNRLFSRKKSLKNSSFECFKVSNGKNKVLASFAPEITEKKLQSRYRRSKSDIAINHVIIVAVGGRVLVYYDQYRRSLM